MSIEQYQNIVIGSGEAGKYLGWHLARLGQRTVVIERSMVGGACPNVACLPSKNIIYSAKAHSIVAHAADFGTETGAVKLNMPGVFRRKREMVDGLIQMHMENFKASGAELLMGEARFTEPKTFAVTLNHGESRVVRGERIFLNVGSRAAMPDVPGLADAKPLTHVEALNLQRLPDHLVILGGGYVGLEFAQAMRRFGSRVTIIQHNARLLPNEDPDVSDALFQLMRDEGIEVLLNTTVLTVSGHSGEKVKLQSRTDAETLALDASDILVATGRTPNTDRLDVEKGGVQLGPHGHIRVNEKLETTAPGVWAMGDCAGSPHFTHVSFDDFRIVRDNLAGGSRTTLNRLVPYCLFTDPELAHVGMNETEARAKNVDYRLARIPMAIILRTRTISATRGFVKALVGRDDRILGFTAFGAEASELLAAVQTAMLGGMPFMALRDAIFTHPTIAEGLTILFSKVPAPTPGTTPT